MRVPARELMMDAVEDGLSLDSRVARTVHPFLLRPGFLTVEWTRGRRARYSSPLRLYLLTSGVFFLATGFAGHAGSPIHFDEKAEQAALREVQREFATAPEAARTLAGTEEEHRKLRELGWIARVIDDRWQAYAKMSSEEIRSRINAAAREWVPRVMFFLVPAAVLILALLWRRRWFSEPVVLALHLHAFAFAVFTAVLVLKLLPWKGPGSVLEPVLHLSLPVYLALSLRRVYGQGWKWTLPKAFAGAVLYLATRTSEIRGSSGSCGPVRSTSHSTIQSTSPSSSTMRWTARHRRGSTAVKKVLSGRRAAGVTSMCVCSDQ